MIPEFEVLNAEEIEVMKLTPVYVTILIAGADEKISQKELQEAVMVTKMKQSRAREELLGYYKVVSPQFEDNLQHVMDTMPDSTEERSHKVIEELEKLNDILPKLPKKFSVNFYASMRDLAKKVAEAAGGVFGYMSIDYNEYKLMDLHMINDPDGSVDQD